MENINLVGMSISPLFDRKKGTMGNRIDCAKEKIGNNLSTAKEQVLTLTAAGVTGYGIQKFKKSLQKFDDKLNKKFERYLADKSFKMNIPFQKILPHERDFAKFRHEQAFAQLPLERRLKTVFKKPVVARLLNKVVKLPAKTKAFALLAFITAGSLLGSAYKNMYNHGRIDQKYEDRAKVLEKTSA